MVITPLIWACIIGFSSLFVTILRKVLYRERKRCKQEIDSSKPFAMSQYYGRVAKSPAQILEEHEQFILELQEEKEKQEIYEIVLWWGLDGLKLKDDGTTEWISRRKTKKVNQDVTYQPCQSQADSIRRLLDMRQSVNSPKDALNMTLTSLQMQSAQIAQNTALFSMLQNSRTPYSCYSAPMHNYGTVNLGCAPNSTIHSTNVVNVCPSPPRLSVKTER